MIIQKIVSIHSGGGLKSNSLAHAPHSNQNGIKAVAYWPSNDMKTEHG